MTGPSVGPPVRFGARGLPAERAAVMAIVDRAPDTPADGTAITTVDRAVDDGADIVDIGAGGSDGVSGSALAEEIRRVASFVASVRGRHPDLLISVRCRHHEVALSAIEAGADILSATSARADPELAEVVAERRCGVVCWPDGVHSSGGVHSVGEFRNVGDVDDVGDVIEALTARAENLVALGVPRSTILLDPTRGLGQNIPQLELLRRCDEVVAAGWPVLLALSDETSFGETVDAGVGGLLDGTLAATAIAAWAGVRIFRVREVRQTRRALEMVASIAGTREPARAVRGLASDAGGR